MEDHHRYRDNLDRIEQSFFMHTLSVHVSWGRRLMQKRNEKKRIWSAAATET